MSKSLLLYHFHSKDALVLAALEWVLNATAARIRADLEPLADPTQAIPVVIDAVWVGPEANRDFFRFYLDGVDHQARSPEFDEVGATCRTIINGLYREVIEASAAAGVLGIEDPDAAATTMRSVIEGFFLQWLQTGRLADQPQCVPRAVPIGGSGAHGLSGSPFNSTVTTLGRSLRIAAWRKQVRSGFRPLVSRDEHVGLGRAWR